MLESNPENRDNITRTEATEIAYLVDAEWLIKECARQHGIDKNQVEPEHVLRYMRLKATSVKSSTWRRYRAAIAFWLQCEKVLAEQQQIAPERYEQARDELGKIRCTAQILEKRTSAKKAKKISKEDFNLLLAEIRRSTSKYAQFAMLILHCGEMMGARPTEWRKASMVRKTVGGEEIYGVTFKNAKATNGRSHGETRTNWFEKGVKTENIVTIAKLIEIASPMKDHEWYRAYNAASKMLNRANKRIWPYRKKTITFYSTRHQFTSDMKASNLDPVNQSAMLGHKVITTAQTTYGLRRHGKTDRDTNLPTPDESNVESVRRFMVEHGHTNDTFKPTRTREMTRERV